MVNGMVKLLCINGRIRGTPPGIRGTQYLIMVGDVKDKGKLYRLWHV